MNDTVFALIRESLFPGKETVISDDIDWEDVYKEMKAQAIAALPLHWLREHPLPDEAVYNDWIRTCYKQENHWVRLMGTQTGLVSLLDRHQIPFVIIKGAAAAMAYPDPYLRAAGDVDFLVRRCDYEKTAALLEESGFELNHEKLSWMHHYGYKYRKVSFELHCRLGSIKQSDDRLISLFEEGIMNSERKEIGSFSFPVLPEDLNGLSLLFHINQHLRTGLGLRQIIDWMMYIDRLPADVWDNQVLPLLRQTGMEKLALTVTAMCQRYLGLRKIVEESESYPCRELMDYILEKGNFGRKSGKYGKIFSVSLVSSSPVRFWKRLQKGGTLRWKATRRHPILRPFSWIYQIGFIMSELIKNRVSPYQFLENNRKGVRQRELIEKLGLRIDREILLPADSGEESRYFQREKSTE